MSTIIVSGALANRPSNGGGAWVRLSWLRGLQRLGCDVVFVEQIDRRRLANAETGDFDIEQSAGVAYFRQVLADFGFADCAALIDNQCETIAGLSRAELFERADAADLLVNISGHLTQPDLMRRLRRKV